MKLTIVPVSILASLAILSSSSARGESECFASEMFNIDEPITIRVKCEGTLGEAVAYSSDGQIVTSTIIPDYLSVTSGWETFQHDGGRFLLATGCIPHSCSSETGAMIYDPEASQFYRIWWTSGTSYQEGIFTEVNGRPLDSSQNYMTFPIGRPPETILEIVFQEWRLWKPIQIVSGRLCSSTYCDGGSEPPGERFPDSNDFSIYGYEEWMSYAAYREKLIDEGWEPAALGQDTRYPYPESDCGGNSGRCYSLFRRGNRQLNITSRPTWNEDYSSVLEIRIERIDERIVTATPENTPVQGDSIQSGGESLSPAGPCEFPWQVDSAGRRCGKRAASERPGGRP